MGITALGLSLHALQEPHGCTDLPHLLKHTREPFMSNKVITEKTIAQFIDTLLEQLGGKYGGEATLNEARVIACCYLTHSLGQSGSITSISKGLGIPTSTAHRAVTNLIDKGWLQDRQDPQDGRRRIIELTEKAIDGGLWQAGIHWLEDYAE